MRGEQTWISDAGRRTPSGERVYRRDGVPWGEPSWEVGDQIGLYYGGTVRVPVLVEVIAGPDFDPALVQEQSGGQELDAGERWPWVTWVKGILRVDLPNAPTLNGLGIEHQVMMRRARLVLTAKQHDQLVGALT